MESFSTFYRFIAKIVLILDFCFSMFYQHEKEKPTPPPQQPIKNDQVTIRHRSDLMGDMDESEGYMRNKWSEQEMIQTRRSVSSSPSSESETNEVQSDDKHQTKIPPQPTPAPNIQTTTQNQMALPNALTMRVNEMAAMNESMQEMLPFAAQQQTIQHPSGQMNQFNFPNENGPVSLFPPTTGSLNTQIPFPSPGTAMFPPTFINAYAAPPSSTNAQQPSKPGDTLTPNSASSSINYPPNMCAAAFTSSSRNIALTTSMMAPSPVQSDVSQISSPNSNNNMQTPITPHVTGNNNNNNISNTKMDFNRRKYPPSDFKFSLLIGFAN